MFTIPKESFEQYMEGYVKINEAVEQLAESYVSTFGEGGREYVSDFEIEYDGVLGSIQIGSEISRCGCCGPDYNSYNIPLAYLLDDDWINTEKNRRAAKERKLKKDRAAKAVIRKKEKAIRDVEKKKKLEAERYKTFLEMKEEYENE
jgi:hypothetical protein